MKIEKISYYSKDGKRVDISHKELRESLFILEMRKLAQEKTQLEAFDLGLLMSNLHHFSACIYSLDDMMSHGDKISMGIFIEGFNKFTGNNFTKDDFVNYFDKLIDDFLSSEDIYLVTENIK